MKASRLNIAKTNVNDETTFNTYKNVALSSCRYPLSAIVQYSSDISATKIPIKFITINKYKLSLEFVRKSKLKI